MPRFDLCAGFVGRPYENDGGDEPNGRFLDFSYVGDAVEKLKAGGGWLLYAPSNLELPKTDDGGGPAGVKDPADEGGGGPAGVVEGSKALNEN